MFMMIDSRDLGAGGSKGVESVLFWGPGPIAGKL